MATWNIEWFGSVTEAPSNDDLQMANVIKVITESGIDLWAVQEIASTSAFNELIDGLGSNYEGQLATNSVTQRVGFIYNTDVIQVRQIRHVLESFEDVFAFRPPLQMEVEVMLPDASIVITFIVVHMKAFADADSYNKRVSASSRLKNHIDFSSLESKPVIVLGDMNDRLTRSIFASQPSPYENFLEDTDNYKFTSYELEMNGSGSFCSNNSCSSTNSMIDHILITNELFGFEAASNATGVLEEASDVIFSYGSSTSDHLPVYARFDFSLHVSNEDNESVPEGFIISPPYPNPVRSTAYLNYQLNAPSSVQLQLFDVTGKELRSIVRTQAGPGRYEEALDFSTYASGMYLLRATINGHSHTYPLFRP